MAEHKDLPDSQLHEPKGVAAASVNTAYVANGSGSGVWKKIGINQLDQTGIYNVNKDYLQTVFIDVSTPDSSILPIVSNRTFTKATAVLSTGITAADATLSFYNGVTLIGTLTIAQSGSTEGSTFVFTPGSNNTFTAPGRLKVVTDGGSTTTARLSIVMEFTLTGS